MFIISGTYNFSPRAVAFRRDYCRNCQGEVVSIAQRTIDALHIFWIPILPLGIWTRWYCGDCWKRPHAPKSAVRRPVRVLVVIFFFLLSVLFWFLAVASMYYSSLDSSDSRYFLIGAIAMSVLLVLTGLWAREYEPDDYKKRLGEVRQYADYECPMCGGLLHISSTMTCNVCGLEHRPLQ